MLGLSKEEEDKPMEEVPSKHERSKLEQEFERRERPTERQQEHESIQ